MRIRALTCAAVLAAVSAQVAAFEIELIPGHPIHHESEKEAGITMALTIAPDENIPTDLTGLCEDLRVAAGLPADQGDQLHLETIFVVPYKGMAVEGYYLPDDGSFGRNALVRSSELLRETLDAIITRAGIPPRVLDEIDVEHEISCETGEPLWHVVWYDVRPLGDEEPDAVIERAYQRFLGIHEITVEYNTESRLSRKAHGTITDG